MDWYLPLLVLTIFRPNLEDRVAVDGGERLVAGPAEEPADRPPAPPRPPPCRRRAAPAANRAVRESSRQARRLQN